MTQDRSFVIRHTEANNDWAVRQLFGELHTLNASFDHRFALADGWERVLGEHLDHVRETGYGLTLLAWHKETPVGLIMMGVHSDSRLFRHRHWAELLAIYVVPTFRGGPIADQLLAAGAAWAYERGYERIQLYVTASNRRAKRFYEQAGFRPVQEIWRMDLGAAEVAPPDDPAGEAAYAHHHDLLSSSSHHLLIDEDDEDDQ
jgi:ribosomal protein S18 acetylase RimI-like enzyme